MKYLLGIDFGGGASKATLIDEMGKITAESTAEYPTLYPEQGACEQSPDDWIAALCKNTSELLEKSGAEYQPMNFLPSLTGAFKAPSAVSNSALYSPSSQYTTET